MRVSGTIPLSCHEDGSDDDTLRRDVVEPKERGEDSLDVVVVPTVTGTIIPPTQV
jgi:hypothetical protein